MPDYSQNLAFVQSRSTLAHELAKAKQKHIGLHQHQERDAGAAAAEQLIGSPQKLRETARGLNLGGSLTMDVGIMHRDLKRYVEDHREAAADAILDALADWSTVLKPSDYRHQHQSLVYDRWTGNSPDNNQEPAQPIDQQTLQRPNLHQSWCDLNTYSIDTNLTTVHLSPITETPINTRSRLVSILHRARDGLGTCTFVELTGDEPYTADELDATVALLRELADQVRATLLGLKAPPAT